MKKVTYFRIIIKVLEHIDKRTRDEYIHRRRSVYANTHIHIHTDPYITYTYRYSYINTDTHIQKHTSFFTFFST